MDEVSVTFEHCVGCRILSELRELVFKPHAPFHLYQEEVHKAAFRGALIYCFFTYVNLCERMLVDSRLRLY